ncbi:uncharacterized protein PRCAT00004910001 [Priceomyces carsonii]|uniref:uncharacterized protein n=1 Tax=Priceomyces carsonii TaxID=28549 RepID=UPI002ED9E3B7|nr:unnamed protein product [Priceomyces carsonii]
MYFRRALSITKTLSKTASEATQTQAKNVRSSKWTPRNGNSFRSFAEYRLKVSQQSPLSVKSRAKA